MFLLPSSSNTNQPNAFSLSDLATQFLWGAGMALAFTTANSLLSGVFSLLTALFTWPLGFLVKSYTFDSGHHHFKTLKRAVKADMLRSVCGSAASLPKILKAPRGGKPARLTISTEQNFSKFLWPGDSSWLPLLVQYDNGEKSSSTRRLDNGAARLSANFKVTGFMLNVTRLQRFLAQHESKQTYLSSARTVYPRPIPKTTFTVYSKDTEQRVYDHVRHFLSLEQTQTKHTGILLHGPPGSGKTSMVWKLSRDFHLNVTQLTHHSLDQSSGTPLFDRDTIVLLVSSSI